MAGIVDELLYLAGGIVTAKVTKKLAEKYADPEAKLTIAQLKGFGKPSVYAHTAGGIVATGYVVNQAQKFGRLKEEEYFLTGFGLTALADSIATGITPAAEIAPAARVRANAGAIRAVSPGGTIATQTRVSGYPMAVDGGLRGMV